MRVHFAFLFIFAVLGPLSWAQTEHQLVRRVVVFPLQTPTQYAASAEEAWWEVRKVLTDNKRFLVASKNFLQQKDVFQSRGELSPADAIILGQLLDANAVITTFLDDKVLRMNVYEAEFGRPLWSQSLQLQPSIPVSQQLVSSAVKLIGDFISSMPYQGFVVRDGLKPGVVYTDSGRQLLKVEVGSDANLQVGDQIQIIRVKSESVRPLFGSGIANTEVFGEGVVDSVNREVITVELKRVTAIADIKENSLVRIPKELSRLREEYALADSLKKNIDPEYFSPEMTELKKEIRENKPLITSLSFLGNLILFLLLAI